MHASCRPEVKVNLAHPARKSRPARRLGFILRRTYRWRKEFGGLKVEQAKRLKALEKKNSRLKRLVAELSLDKQILTDVVKKKL